MTIPVPEVDVNDSPAPRQTVMNYDKDRGERRVDVTLRAPCRGYRANQPRTEGKAMSDLKVNTATMSLPGAFSPPCAYCENGRF